MEGWALPMFDRLICLLSPLINSLPPRPIQSTMRRYFLAHLKHILWITAHRPWFPLLVLLMCVAASVSFAVPSSAVLIAAVMLRPQRWFLIAVMAMLGAALGGTFLAWTFHDQAWSYMQGRFPELSASPLWLKVEALVKEQGLPALALVSAAPLPQTPALVVCALSGLSLPGIFLALLAGKLFKFSLIAWVVAKFPERFHHYLHRAEAK